MILTDCEGSLQPPSGTTVCPVDYGICRMCGKLRRTEFYNGKMVVESHQREDVLAEIENGDLDA